MAADWEPDTHRRTDLSFAVQMQPPISMKRRTSQQIKIGQYDLGSRRVDLFGTTGNGGRFDTAPLDNSGVTRILVGLEQKQWGEAVSVLLHEAYELSFHDIGARYLPDLDFGYGADGYVFVMTHPKFNEVCGRVGIFISACLPDLSDAFKKFNLSRRTK